MAAGWSKVEGVQGQSIVTHSYEVTAATNGSIADSAVIELDGLLLAVSISLDAVTPPNSITPVLKRRSGTALPIVGSALTASAEEIKPDSSAPYVLISNGVILSASGNTTPNAKAVFKLHMLKTIS